MSLWTRTVGEFSQKKTTINYDYLFFIYITIVTAAQKSSYVIKIFTFCENCKSTT